MKVNIGKGGQDPAELPYGAWAGFFPVLLAAVLGGSPIAAQMISTLTQAPRTLMGGGPTMDKAIKAAFRGEHLVSRKQHSRVRITTEGLLLRDVQGRVREDVSAVAEWGEMREAASFGSIVSGTKSIVLDHDRNVALVKPGSPSSASGAAASPLFPGTHFQVVGRADIAGCDCREVAFWSDPPADHSLQGSAWICDELGLVLKEIGESKEESYSWEVTRLERVEPAASEFRIPEGYDAYDVTGIGTLTPRDR